MIHVHVDRLFREFRPLPKELSMLSMVIYYSIKHGKLNCFIDCFILIIKHSLSIKLSSKPNFKQLTIHFDIAQDVMSYEISLFHYKPPLR